MGHGRVVCGLPQSAQDSRGTAGPGRLIRGERVDTDRAPPHVAVVRAATSLERVLSRSHAGPRASSGLRSITATLPFLSVAALGVPPPSGAVLSGPPHTVLLATIPAADSVHRAEVRELVLRFSGPVQVALSTITLTGPSGPLTSGPVEFVPGSQDQEIRIGLAEALVTGSYTVEWRTAGPDSHPLNGSYAFSVEWAPDTGEEGAALPPVPTPGSSPEPGGEGSPPPGSEYDKEPTTKPSESGPPETMDAGRAPVAVFIRWAFFLSLVGMLGAPTFRLGVVDPLLADPLHRGVANVATARARVVAWSAAALATVVLPARLWRQSAELFGEGALEASSLSRLLASPWGGAWGLEAAMLTLFVVGALLVGMRKDRRRGWWIMLCAGAGTALVPALSGHASGTPAAARGFAVLNDAAHVVAASVWMGTLAVLVFAGIGAAASAQSASAVLAGAPADRERLPERDAPRPPSLLPPLARMVSAFSRFALAAVALLVATGVVNAWLHLGSLDALVSTPYGRTLLLKLGLVAVAGSFGFYNWRVVRPALARAPDAGLIKTTASVELLVGLAILLVTAVLVATPPPTP